MKKVKNVFYKNWYRVVSGQGYVQIWFFVTENYELDGEQFEDVRVAQEEGIYDNLEQASYLIEHLKDIGAEIEYHTLGTYTGVTEGED